MGGEGKRHGAGATGRGTQGITGDEATQRCHSCVGPSHQKHVSRGLTLQDTVEKTFQAVKTHQVDFAVNVHLLLFYNHCF